MTGQRRASWAAPAAAFAVLAPIAAHAALTADPRVAVDPNQPPWNAIARVQTNIGSRCTGVLIGPATVLTAAHCLYNPRTRAFLEPVSLHVLFGFQRDQYRLHRLVARFVTGPGFQPGKGPATSDWARLELTEPVPNATAPLPLADIKPAAGMAVILAGYNQDRTQLLLADSACHVIRADELPGGGIVFAHNCAATRGTSGAPLLVEEKNRWAVLGINLAAGREANLALYFSRIAR